MTAAIYYHPEAYSTAGPKLMGRNAAGESFLRGFFAHSRTDAFWVQAGKTEHAQAFAAQAREFGRNEPVKLVSKNNLGALVKPGTLYFPGPDIVDCAWQRSFFGHGSWSLCGVTHTTSSVAAMDAIAGLLVAPIHPWDALICTSLAVKDNVQRVLQTQADYLARRLGASRLIQPQLPVIPLGIHCDDFVFSSAQHSAAREQLALGNALVVLYLGRLSFHAKAHPLAMYQALERAKSKLPAGQEVVLLECGWHANESIRRAFAEAAALACPSVRVITLDGRVEAQRQAAWAAADVFCSLSDNIQESFGIVPLEAMAAGLPVVVSDWDGYRDSVRHGIDGYCVPTLMPAAGLGRDLAMRHALGVDTYDVYCGNASSLVTVDVEAAVHAFAELFASPELRSRMGEAGRQRAREMYDWKAIIPRYETLWQQLGEIRSREGKALQAQTHPWPARMDPFAAFKAYPSTRLKPSTVLALSGADSMERLGRLRGLTMVTSARHVLPEQTECESFLIDLESGPKSAGDLVKVLPKERQTLGLRSLAWLLKLGVVKLAA